MIRILFCFNCCGAPQSSRPDRGKAAAIKSNEKLVEEANFKSLLPTNEKDQLLANQIRANNDNYGLKESNNNNKVNSQSGNITLLTSAQAKPQFQQTTTGQAGPEDDSCSLQASTSAPQETAFVSRLGSLSSRSLQQSDHEHSAAYRAGESISLHYDDGSISPPSSIDVDSFRELPDNETDVTGQQGRDLSKPITADTDEGINKSTAAAAPEIAARQPSQSSLATTSTVTTTTNRPPTTSAQKPITSTTKIGDYARLEYSPVEDLESVTTYNSQSRFGSEKGGRQAISGPNSATTSRPGSFRNTSGNVSRRSSQGIESTSISIASQLSNEQMFQQNLTNMLESANSPTPYIPLFGTIGLPLGPPLDSNTATETAKTSPETPGAALTSASQDSLDGAASMDDSPQTSRAPGGTMGSGSAPVGAALVNDSVEDSAAGEEVAALTARSLPLDKTTTTARLAQAEPDLGSSGERMESSLSMATTASGGLTNPTPTPSEMSGTSQNKKKKSKLRAGKLFKKFKRAGTKKDSKEGSVDSKVESVENP